MLTTKINFHFQANLFFNSSYPVCIYRWWRCSVLCKCFILISRWLEALNKVLHTVIEGVLPLCILPSLTFPLILPLLLVWVLSWRRDSTPTASYGHSLSFKNTMLTFLFYCWVTFEWLSLTDFKTVIYWNLFQNGYSTLYWRNPPKYNPQSWHTDKGIRRYDK